MRKKIFAFLLLSALYAGAQEVPDWENPIVVGINKEPYHATLTLPFAKSRLQRIHIPERQVAISMVCRPGKAPGRLLQE